MHTIGETLYGEWDETDERMTKARGYLITDASGNHLAIVGGADEAFTERTEGAATARRIANALNQEDAARKMLGALKLITTQRANSNSEPDVMGACLDYIEETAVAAIAAAEAAGLTVGEG